MLSAKHVKKEQRQVNKKFCELKGGIIGIVEEAQETRFGISLKYGPCYVKGTLILPLRKFWRKTRKYVHNFYRFVTHAYFTQGNGSPK